MNRNKALKTRNELIFKMAMEGTSNDELSVIFNQEKETIKMIVDTLWLMKDKKQLFNI